jgi:hypothetical protein
MSDPNTVTDFIGYISENIKELSILENAGNNTIEVIVETNPIEVISSPTTVTITAANAANLFHEQLNITTDNIVPNLSYLPLNGFVSFNLYGIIFSTVNIQGDNTTTVTPSGEFSVTGQNVTFDKNNAGFVLTAGSFLVAIYQRSLQ